MNIFSTHTLVKVVENLNRSASFLLDTFFAQVQTCETEEIFFDIDKSKPRLAPFVSPLVAGKVMTSDGFETMSFKPAYVKDKRVFKANSPLKRSIGEKIGGELSPQQRLEKALGIALANQLENLTRREEVMAAEALLTGKVTVKGENYPTQVIDFKRDSSLTLGLAGDKKWSKTPDVIDNLEDWAAQLQNKSGAAARTVVMEPLAWRSFRKNAKVEKFLELRRGTDNTLNVDPATSLQGNEKARYKGSIGDFDIYTYNDVYVDADGQTKNLLPKYSVLLGSIESLEGTRCYGVIQDEKAGYKATRYFTKSWCEEDPAVRWLLMQSAPLIVPYRPNASMAIKVAEDSD